MYKIVALLFVTLQFVRGQTIASVYNPAAYNGIAANVVTEAGIANTLAYNPAVNALVNPATFEPVPQVPNGIPGINYGLGLSDLSASKGPGLKITSTSPITPTGVTVESENMVMEGPVAVSGQLPFLGVVSMEGPLPASGHGSVAYGCGNGNVGIVNEVPEPAVTNVPGLPGHGYTPMQQRPLH